MVIKHLRFYYLFLVICLLLIFTQNFFVCLFAYPLFAIYSIFFYYQNRKKDIYLKDKLFIISLLMAALQEFLSLWRPNKWIVITEIFILLLMSLLFIRAIKHEKTYLLLGSKKGIMATLIITIASFLGFVYLFLPFIPNTLIFPIFIHCTSLFFAFFIALNRKINRQSYLLIILGIIMFIITSGIAGISLFIHPFVRVAFYEKLSFMLGVCFVTQGMIHSHWTSIK